MCGIFGIIKKKSALIECLEGLSNLEYRGYDSAGLATIFQGKLESFKHIGKVALLKQVIQKEEFTVDIALGHTRWATHGDVTLLNAHPHCDEKKSLMIVHNGIIENHAMLRQDLEDKGIKFESETDSEVIAQLLSYHYEGDPIKAISKTMKQLQGSYAIGMIHEKHPDQLFAICDQMTLSVGLSDIGAGISSDPHAFNAGFSKGFFLKDREIAVLDLSGCFVYDENMEAVFRKIETFDAHETKVSKEGFKHYMIKEISEEPSAVSNSFADRIAKVEGKWKVDNLFDRLDFSLQKLAHCSEVEFIACGSSYHAALYGADLLEEMQIPAKAQIASEFRIRNEIPANKLYVAISQSGETADTLSAIKEIRKRGGVVIVLCNRLGSTMERNADGVIYMRVGVEMSVASTKTYVASLTLLFLFALYLAQLKKLHVEVHPLLDGLIQTPKLMQEILQNGEKVHQLAAKYAALEQFLFLGRRNLVFTAMEGALKLKEIAYSFSSAYPAGEMKHGPIALIDDKCLTIALCSHKDTFSKMMTSLMEVKTRKSNTLAFVAQDSGFVVPDVDLFFIPKVHDLLSPFLFATAMHLFAYYVALERKLEIDRPRNLAKSVTVE